MAKIEPKIFDELKTALVSFGDKYFVGEVLNRSKLTDDLRNYDEALLSKLFEVDFIKQHFIKEVAGQKLFQIEQLEEAVLYNDYWDTSYTKYENRVGLASKGKFLQDSQDVVLDFPFKDGVLTASMTKEDNENGYDDAFLNEVIEKDEIDRLFDKKVFVNSKKYDENGESAVTEFDEDKDNLIIKGNNLLALHAIKDKYAGKVKLIYIDPPYNTKNDSFVYNDKFSHSSWLAFMKNRLEISHDLLSDDGIIFIQSDDNEQAYLKILASDIFGSSNFVSTVPVISNLKGNQDQYGFAGTHEYLTVFVKNTSFAKFNNLLITDESVDEWEEDEVGYFKKGANLKATGVNAPRTKRPNLYYPIYISSAGKIQFERQSESDFELLPITDGQEVSWRWKRETMKRLIDDVILVKGTDGYSIYKKQRPELGDLPSKKAKSVFYRPEYSSGNGTNQLKTLFGEKKFSFPKPEHLISDIIQIGSNENDIVLDFFMGSATTQAVAMKMNRRFIGIEQMDYINEVSVPRLQKVIAGEQGGISKDVNWQGGGSFVYTELMPKNMGYLQDIIHAKTLDDLKVVYNRMLEGTDTMEPADISFRADLSKIDWLQGFDENKRLLVKLLDKNGLYYNYSEIDDKNVRDLISDEDYTFNKNFYEGGD